MTGGGGCSLGVEAFDGVGEEDVGEDVVEGEVDGGWRGA